MKHKYVRLDHFQELMKLIYKRDGYMDWMDEYEKYDNKVKKTIEWIERNAKEFTEDSDARDKRIEEVAKRVVKRNGPGLKRLSED